MPVDSLLQPIDSLLQPVDSLLQPIDCPERSTIMPYRDSRYGFRIENLDMMSVSRFLDMAPYRESQYATSSVSRISIWHRIEVSSICKILSICSSVSTFSIWSRYASPYRESSIRIDILDTENDRIVKTQYVSTLRILRESHLPGAATGSGARFA